ncbi:MAG: hypothetical protein GY758_13345, partial [Fuerstiella sp.]|nr:hypothetical protein [Fuerstiella sp.]
MINSNLNSGDDIGVTSHAAMVVDQAVFDAGDNILLKTMQSNAGTLALTNSDLTAGNDITVKAKAGLTEFNNQYQAGGNIEVTPANDTPAVTVTAPNDGEDWAVGSVQNITWTATDNVGVTSVDLYYSNSGSGGTFNLIALGEANDGIFSWTVPNDPTANAFVRVVAHDAAGNTGEDLTNLDFTITQVTVPLSTPSWTTEGNTKTTDEFQPVSWNPVSGATEYQVWYTNVSTGANPFLLTTTTQTTFTPTRALPIGQYNIWVRAQRDSQNSVWGPGLAMRVWSRVTLHTPEFQQTSLTPALTWDELNGATSYRIWYDNITTGVQQVIDTTVAGTSFTPSQDLGLGQYRVWVAGIDARGIQARWSYPIDFTVGPQAVSPIIPAFTRRPVFEWTSVPDTGSYELYIHTPSGVLQPAGISGTSWTPDTDLPSGAFYWWVGGLTDSNVAAPWSERAAGDTDGRTSLITPTGPGYSGTPLFQWQSVKNAATYILHVQRLSDGQVVIRQDSL